MFTGVVLGGAAGFLLISATRNHAQDAGVGTVYTANENAFSVSALDHQSLAQLHADIAPTQGSTAVAVSRDGLRVYCAGGDVLTAIDATTDTIVDSEALSASDQLTDVVVSPDNTKVFAT